jgi:hypothetical protein
MNAYELADELDRVLQVLGCDNRVPRMLRQQAEKISNMEIWEKKYLDRIAELEQEKIRAYDNGYEDGQKALQNQADRIAELETVLRSIANEQIELSHDKIKWQCQDHIRWAKDILK